MQRLYSDEVDNKLFELCCKMPKPNFSVQDAIMRIEKYVPDENRITKDVLLGGILYAYANASPPTTRQHIYRIICQFCPADRTTLECKMDGATEAQQMDVLVALEKRYSMEIGEDSKLDPMQLVVRANSNLFHENMELRRQVEYFQAEFGLQAIVKAHSDVVEKLYQCVAQIEVMQHQNETLKGKMQIYSDRWKSF